MKTNRQGQDHSDSGCVHLSVDVPTEFFPAL